MGAKRSAAWYLAAPVPTLLVIEGFRFFFFSNEGMEPPHVHEKHQKQFLEQWHEYFSP